MLQAYLRGIDIWKGTFGKRSIMRRELLLQALDAQERAIEGESKLRSTGIVMAAVGVDPKKAKKVLSDFTREHDRLDMVRNLDIRSLFRNSRAATTEEAEKVYEALHRAGKLGDMDEEDDSSISTNDPDA